MLLTLNINADIGVPGLPNPPSSKWENAKFVLQYKDGGSTQPNAITTEPLKLSAFAFEKVSDVRHDVFLFPVLVKLTDSAEKPLHSIYFDMSDLVFKSSVNVSKQFSIEGFRTLSISASLSEPLPKFPDDLLRYRILKLRNPPFGESDPLTVCDCSAGFAVVKRSEVHDFESFELKMQFTHSGHKGISKFDLWSLFQVVGTRDESAANVKGLTRSMRSEAPVLLVQNAEKIAGPVPQFTDHQTALRVEFDFYHGSAPLVYPLPAYRAVVICPYSETRIVSLLESGASDFQKRPLIEPAVPIAVVSEVAPPAAKGSAKAPPAAAAAAAAAKPPAAAKPAAAAPTKGGKGAPAVAADIPPEPMMAPEPRAQKQFLCGFEILDDEFRVNFVSCTDVETLKKICRDVYALSNGDNDDIVVLFNSEFKFAEGGRESGLQKLKIQRFFADVQNSSLRLKILQLLKCRKMNEVTSQNIWLSDDDFKTLKKLGADVYPTVTEARSRATSAVSVSAANAPANHAVQRMMALQEGDTFDSTGKFLSPNAFQDESTGVVFRIATVPENLNIVTRKFIRAKFVGGVDQVVELVDFRDATTAVMHTTNYDYIRERMQSDRLRAKRNFVRENVGAVPGVDAQSRSLAGTTASRYMDDVPGDFPVYMYSCQRLNSVELQKKKLREEVSTRSKSGKYYTYSNEFLSASVPSVDMEDHERMTRRQELSTFSTCQPRHPSQFNKHPRRPSSTRVEELAIPWIDPVDSERARLRKEKSSFTTLVGSRPGLFDSTLTSLKLPDAKDLLEDREKEVLTWQGKLVVDDPDFKIQYRSAGKFKDILLDEPKKKGLQSLARIVPPVSMHQSDNTYMDPARVPYYYSLKTEKLIRSDLVAAIGSPAKDDGGFKRHLHVDRSKVTYKPSIPLTEAEKRGPLYGKM
eukprot:ANDGO_05299.mRNA.1 hypothetical protein SDRG_09844